MANRLEPLNLADFSGGLNLRTSQFQLAHTESPQMNNIVIDPLGGIYTRQGWQRWNMDDIVVDPEVWDPRRAFLQQLSDGTDLIYIAANQLLYYTSGTTTFTEAAFPVEATTHMADFASFGDTVYIVCGRENQTFKRVDVAAPVSLLSTGAGSWNDDYEAPEGGVFPQAELVEAHAGYAFVANVDEDGTDFPNRLRWSHPTSQEDWAELDFIDIEIGGAAITGLMSYEDHLLIFKNDSVWALYGYDAESWQLIQKSSTIGAMGPQGITRNEAVVFFHSASDGGGIYAYNGERPQEISEPLRVAFADMSTPQLVWVGWLMRKLWVTLPWTYDGPTTDNSAVFVFDPSVGKTGAWTYFTSTAGGLGPLVGGSNVDSQIRPLGVLRDTETPCVVRLDAIDEAYDWISDEAVIGVSVSPATWELMILTTIEGDEVIASGMPGFEPFETVYRTPWLTAGWPTRKKSWRRPDFVMRDFNVSHQIRVQSFRDYEELNPRRQSTIEVTSPGGAIWNNFNWGDGTIWGDGDVRGASIRRGSSFGMCRALQLRVSGLTRGARWGIDAIVAKLVLRRFR